MDRRMGEEELLPVKVLIPFSESLKISLRVFVSAKKCIQNTAGQLRAAIPDKKGLRREKRYPHPALQCYLTST